MRRRRLLAAMAGATGLLAGCPAGPRDTGTTTQRSDSQSAATEPSFSGTADSTTDGTATEPTDTQTPKTATPAQAGTVSVVDIETSIPDINVELTLDRAKITPAATARVACTLTNTGAERPFWFGYAPPLYQPWEEALDGDGTGWVLQDPTYRESERASDQCWRPTQGYGIEGRPETEYTLGSGESITSRTEFWTADEAAVCLPTGRFRFDNEVRIGEGLATADKESWSVVFRVRE